MTERYKPINEAHFSFIEENDIVNIERQIKYFYTEDMPREYKYVISFFTKKAFEEIGLNEEDWDVEPEVKESTGVRDTLCICNHEIEYTNKVLYKPLNTSFTIGSVCIKKNQPHLYEILKKKRAERKGQMCKYCKITKLDRRRELTKKEGCCDPCFHTHLRHRRVMDYLNDKRKLIQQYGKQFLLTKKPYIYYIHFEFFMPYDKENQQLSRLRMILNNTNWEWIYKIKTKWLLSFQPNNPFYKSILDQVYKKGSLSPKQKETIDNQFQRKLKDLCS
jgi:hypothetical protein